MFEPIEKVQSDFPYLVIRSSYLFVAAAVGFAYLYLAAFPGTTKEEKFGSFIYGSSLLVVSLALSVPVFPYVVWKLAKHERPIFWGIALVVAAIPILTLFLVNIFWH